MKKLKTVIGLAAIVILMPFVIVAQDLKEYRWKNRVIIIVSEERSGDQVKEQLSELGSDSTGLVERKLEILHVSGNFYRNLENPSNWIEIDNSSLDKFQNSKSPFSFYLIGLDGGVKMQEERVVPVREIFAIIDGMPMRRAELGGNKK